METPNIGPLSPHFGLRRSAPDRRRPRQQRQLFDEAVRRLTAGAGDEAAAGETTEPVDLQPRAPNGRREGEDGDRHVDVLA